MDSSLDGGRTSEVYGAREDPYGCVSEGTVVHVAGSGAAWFSIEALDVRRALRCSEVDRCKLEASAM